RLQDREHQRENHQLDRDGDGGADGFLGDELCVGRNPERDETAGEDHDQVVLDDGDRSLTSDDEERGENRDECENHDEALAEVAPPGIVYRRGERLAGLEAQAGDMRWIVEQVAPAWDAASTG